MPEIDWNEVVDWRDFATDLLEDCRSNDVSLTKGQKKFIKSLYHQRISLQEFVLGIRGFIAGSRDSNLMRHIVCRILDPYSYEACPDWQWVIYHNFCEKLQNFL